MPNNAFYCKDTDIIAWDQNYLERFDGAGHDEFDWKVVAHEEGHAIQARIDPSLVGPAPELGADCFAGAALYGAVQDGQLQIGDDVPTKLAEDYAKIGDPQPWSGPKDHGTGAQRMAAFTTGANGGPEACINYQPSTNPV